MTYAIIALFITSAICIFSLFRANKNKERNTREQYAIRSLAAILSLCTLGISTITSKQSIPEQVLYLISLASGHPLPKAETASASEQILTALIVVFACYLISKSHAHWDGLISKDEETKRRLQISNNLFNQGFDEANRIVKRLPKREAYQAEQRIESVSTPDEPKIVWHTHARELFELWYANVRFSVDSIWNPRHYCWIGKDITENSPIVLFCLQSQPNAEHIKEAKRFSNKVAANCKIFILYNDSNSAFSTHGQVTIISEEYLYENIVDFTDYINDIFYRVESQKFSNTEISISNIYTPSSISADSAGQNIIAPDLGRYLYNWAHLPPGKQLAIMGEYGQGKSTAALMYVYQSLKSSFKESAGRVPLLIELRGKSPANLSPIELLAVWAQQYQLHAAALMKLQIAGRLTLIFEGFDEMANIANAEARISHFRALWRLAFSKSKIIFTGRRNLFFEENEIEIVFKGAAQQNSIQLCELVHLCPFDTNQISQSLRWMSNEQEKQEIITAAKLSDQIREIVSRPSLLFIVAALWGDLRNSLIAGSLTSAQVIDKFIEHSYVRQQVKESAQRFMTLSTTERRYFHEGIAVFMAARGKTNQISAQDMDVAIERLYNAYPENCHISESIILETDRKPLKYRFESQRDALEAISTDVRTHGILVNEIGVRSAFRFAHKSFYEVLAAKFQAYLLLDKDPMIYHAIKSTTDGNSMSVREGNPEILNFFSQIFMHHLRSNLNENDEIGIVAFDKLTGARKTNKVNRIIKVMVFRLFNRKTRIRTVTGMTIIASAISILNIYLLAKTGHSSSSWKFDFMNPFFLGIIFGISFFVLSRTGYAPQILLSRVYLAAAVMVVDDRSRHSSELQKFLARLFGAKQVVQLTDQALERYGIDHEHRELSHIDR